MRKFTHWQATVLSRLSPRDELGREELLAMFEPGLPKDEAFEAFDLFEQEYGIPAGMFRPGDPLSALFERVTTCNPLRWMGYQVRAFDGEAELGYQLHKKLRQHGTDTAWKYGSVRTFGDFVRAWCGQHPT